MLLMQRMSRESWAFSEDLRPTILFVAHRIAVLSTASKDDMVQPSYSITGKPATARDYQEVGRLVASMGSSRRNSDSS